MPALGAGIHVFFVTRPKTWMAGTSPAMTEVGLSFRPHKTLSRPFVLQNIESNVPIDHVDQTAVVERNVVALRRGSARHRLGNEIADLARAHRIGYIDDPQAAAEPHGMDDIARDPLAELMRAEARAVRAAEG